MKNDLSSWGVEFIDEPVDMGGWGIRVVHLRDPEGYIIELCQNLPLEKLDKDLLDDMEKFE